MVCLERAGVHVGEGGGGGVHQIKAPIGQSISLATAANTNLACSALRCMQGYRLEALQPFGAVVHGLQLRARPCTTLRDMLLHDAARHGFLVFRNQSLPGDALRRVSTFFGELAVAHTCHPEAVHCDILRCAFHLGPCLCAGAALTVTCAAVACTVAQAV